MTTTPGRSAGGGTTAAGRFDWRVEGVFLAAWALLGLGMYLGAFAPEARDRRAALADQELLLANERDLDRVQTLVRDTRARLTRAEQDREQTPVRLRRASEVNERLARISAIGEAAGVKIDQLEPEKPAPFGRYAVVTIRVAGVASYSNLAGLIHRLHEEFPDTAAKAFRIAATQEPGSANGRFSVDLAWYTAPDAGPAPR